MHILNIILCTHDRKYPYHVKQTEVMHMCSTAQKHQIQSYYCIYAHDVQHSLFPHFLLRSVNYASQAGKDHQTPGPDGTCSHTVTV